MLIIPLTVSREALPPLVLPRLTASLTASLAASLAAILLRISQRHPVQ